MDLLGGSGAPGRGSILGRVTTYQGQPIAEAVVMITGRSPSHKDIAALTDARGSYQFDHLVPGEYTLLVNTDEHGMQTLQTHVEAGQIARLDFTLPD